MTIDGREVRATAHFRNVDRLTRMVQGHGLWMSKSCAWRVKVKHDVTSASVKEAARARLGSMVEIIPYQNLHSQA